MLPFRKSKEQIKAALSARHIADDGDQATADQQQLVARWPWQKLRQLRRRYEAAHREEPDAYLSKKWESLRPT